MQLREKDKSTREYIDIAKKVHTITKKYSVPLIIDDRIDVAMAIGAEGVHLGQSDMSVDIARKILGEDYIIGATAKTVRQATEAYRSDPPPEPPGSPGSRNGPGTPGCPWRRVS